MNLYCVTTDTNSEPIFGNLFQTQVSAYMCIFFSISRRGGSNIYSQHIIVYGEILKIDRCDLYRYPLLMAL